jgi:hypothetical protein
MRKSLLAAFTVAALSSTAALAQEPATRNPTPLARDNAPRTYQDEALPPATDSRARTDTRQAQAPRDARDEDRDDRRAGDEGSRDLFCRRDAADRTGYTGEAAREEPARGAQGGAVATAREVEADYADAYEACMDTAQDDDIRDDDGRYAADYGPPPPAYYAPRPYPYYYQPYSGFYAPRVYGPSFGFSFGIGPSYRGAYRGAYRGGFSGPRRGFAGPGRRR